MLTAAELSSMRSTAEQALPGTAVIQQSTTVSDGGGGGTLTWAASGTFDCRISPMTAPQNPEVMEGGRISPDADWIVTLPTTAAITTEDRLIIDAGTYNVQALRSPRSYEITRRVEACLIT